MSQATLPQGPYRNSNLFSGYYLDEHVYELDAWDCDAEAREAFEALRNLYETRSDALSSYDEAPLRNHWIDKVLKELGYETLEETPLVDTRGSIDRTLYDTEDDQMAAAAMKADGEHTGMYGQSLSILEAKQWNADFTEQFSNRRYRDASHQIKSYLEHTPESVSWGILTNGKKWRLYGTNDYETETYYEVDLPELLASDSVEIFKYFYVFFRSNAFRESAGTTFLDTVWSESEIAAQELGEDLQDNVFTALRVLGEGFLETNDLTIAPDDGEQLGKLKEQSLVLLYRLMFVLYAESRGLIDPEDPNRRSEYEENFSLGVLRHDIRENVGETLDEVAFDREFSEYSFSIWNRLERLFSLVDAGNDDLGIPPYNGGLFDPDQHEFLAEYEVADTYMAEVIYRLSTTETDDGFVPADYADLDTRHLGTIYEGLLEHEFAVAPEAQAAVAEDSGQVWKPANEVSVAEAVETVEEDELYVVNDEGERKATGAYYTPDYVVTYIVEETVGSLLDEIEEELVDLEPGTQDYVVAFWERVTDLKILDPAMGSGHFLTKATGYLADAVMKRVHELESGSLFDEELVRRTISRECIYGVDVNGMAVELAKLSMWLETLAADQPLAFLDHHLKTGNSLIGSDITEVLSSDDGDSDGDAGTTTNEAEGMVQSSLFDYFDRVRREALDHVMALMGELLAIENETLEDVHSMEDLYAEIRDDPLYEHLQAMTTVHTASEFGLDVPEDAIERMARAIEDESKWAEIEATDWFCTAQAMADEEGFFHWELEFPAVFFNGDGERLASAGFDAVIGNPPYVNIVSIPDNHTSYLSTYDTAFRRFDLYVLFAERAIEITQNGGQHSFIVPDKILSESYAQKWRGVTLSETYLRQILDLRTERVFEDATNSPIVYVIENSEPDENSTVSIFDSQQTVRSNLPIKPFTHVPGSQIRIDWTENTESVLDSIRTETKPLSRVMYASWGAQPGNAERFVFEEDQPDLDDMKSLIKGSDISRYNIDYSGRHLWYNRNELHRPAFPELFENDKICLRKVAGEKGLIASFDDQQYYTEDSVINLIRKSDLAQADDDVLSARGIEVKDEHRPTEENSQSLVYDRDSTIYLDDRELSDQISTKNLLGLINSSTIEYYYKMAVSGQLNVFPEHIRTLPFRHDGEMFDNIGSHVDDLLRYKEQKANLNLGLLDYLGTYENGPTLGEIGYNPPNGLADSILNKKKPEVAEFETVRITDVQIERDDDRLRMLAVPYVKPEGAGRGEYETLDPVPAMEFTGLDESQADLIEAFVPHAVTEADGFASYWDDATATISPLDRLEGLTLPKLDDVAGGIERYMDAHERATELDEQIEETNEFINEIVYELYELTDEEIGIIEETVRS